MSILLFLAAIDIMLAAPKPAEVAMMAEPPAAAMTVAGLLLAEEADPAAHAATRKARQDELSREILRTRLAWKGIPCDETDPACQAAADRIANENIDHAIAEQRYIGQFTYAALLGEKMTPPQLAAAAQYLSTPNGAGLAAGLRVIIAPSSNAKAFYTALGEAQRRSQLRWSKTRAMEAFFDATKTLPRSRLSVPAPPQMRPVASPPPSASK